MTETTSVQQANHELVAEHAQLHELVEEIRGARDRAQALGALARLQEQVLAHFNLEERPGGLYDTLGVCVPAFRRPLAQLVDDHYRISASLRDMRERANAPWGTDGEMLRRDVARLAAALAEHEQRERQMVEQALAGES